MVTDEQHDRRKRAWATRRAKYGGRGHSGSYSRGKPNDGALALVIRLCAEGVLSEGQVARATGLDRVDVRRMVDATLTPEPPHAQ